MKISICLCTTKNEIEAKKIAKILINSKLAACVNIIPNITSIYSWNDEILEDNEYLLIIKTMEHFFDEIKDTIKLNHSYDIPEIILINPEHIEANYKKWVYGVLK